MNKKLLFTLPLVATMLASCTGTKHYETSNYFENVEWVNHDEDFKILQLCDIHLSQSDIYDKHLALINKTIEESHANMIVINGDSFTYADKKIVNLLFGFIDSKEIPWTFTFGNHDDQGYYSDTYVQRLLASGKFKNVKFLNLEDDDVTGRSNFAINIFQQDRDTNGRPVVGTKKTKFQVYLFDSHSYNFDTLAYDFIKQDQIDWYKRMVNYSTSQNGGVVPSAAYFHIPTPEFYAAWHDYEEGKANSVSMIEGATSEEFSGGPTIESDTHIFDVFQEMGSTIAVSCAHDHINDSVLKYTDQQGEPSIYLCFGVHSTNRIYFDESKLGGQVISISHLDQKELSFNNIKLTYEEVEGK